MNRTPARETLLILFLTMFPQAAVSMLCMAPPIMAKYISASIGLPEQVTGAYISVLYAFVMITSTGASYLISRIGPLRTSFGCVVLGGVALPLFATGDAKAALVATILIGLSYGPLTTVGSHIMGHYRDSVTLALIVSIRQTSVPLGGLLAGLVVPSLVLGLGWKAACVALGLTTALLGLLVGVAMPAIRDETAPRHHSARDNPFAAIRFILQRRRVLGLSIISLVFAGMQLILSSFLVIYLTEVARLNLVTAGVLLGASQIAGVAGRLAWGFVAGRIIGPRLVLLAIGVLIAVASSLTGWFSPRWPIPLIGIVVILFGATASGWNGVFLAEIIREAEPGQVASVTGGSLVFTYLGVVAGPLLFAALTTWIGYSSAFLVVAVIVIATTVFNLGGNINVPGRAFGGERN